MDQDPTGWTVRSNGGPVHVRAVIYGFFHDGGQVFAANDHDHDGQYAATGHDHMIEQDSGTATDIGPEEGAGATENVIDLGAQCPAGSNETHSVLVQYSGTLNQDLLVGLAAEVELQLFVDDVEVTDAVLDVEVTNLNVTGKVPVARSWLLGALDPGSHTIEVRAERQDALLGPVTVELEMIVESRGWTC